MVPLPGDLLAGTRSTSPSASFCPSYLCLCPNLSFDAYGEYTYGTVIGYGFRSGIYAAYYGYGYGTTSVFASQCLTAATFGGSTDYG